MPYRHQWNTLVIGALHIAHTHLQFANMELVSLNPSLQLLHSILPLDGRKKTHTGFTQRLDRTQQTDNSRSPSSDIPTSYAVTFIALKLQKPDITGRQAAYRYTNSPFLQMDVLPHSTYISIQLLLLGA